MFSQLNSLAVTASDQEFMSFMLRVVGVSVAMIIVAGGVLLLFIRALRASRADDRRSRTKVLVLLATLIVVIVSFVLVLLFLAYRV
jgi:uncharacterized membrane protein YidH (DUF202 family)